MSKISPCLWFDGQAEEAAAFYTATFPDSQITGISRYGENMPYPEGTALLVEFTLFGQGHQALNGGPHFSFNEAVSLSISCKDQAEIDRYFDALTADGGSPGPCGWLKDKYGLSWQLTPEPFITILKSGDKDAVARGMAAMMTMQKLDIAALEAAAAGTTQAGTVQDA
jgi:predicted 3-demethylubiquinone-9 3-methyltransferase (glyoxalase superfamily)